MSQRDTTYAGISRMYSGVCRNSSILPVYIPHMWYLSGNVRVNAIPESVFLPVNRQLTDMGGTACREGGRERRGRENERIKTEQIQKMPRGVSRKSISSAVEESNNEGGSYKRLTGIYWEQRSQNKKTGVGGNS